MRIKILITIAVASMVESTRSSQWSYNYLGIDSVTNMILDVYKSFTKKVQSNDCGGCFIDVTQLTYPEVVFVKNGALAIPSNGKISFNCGEIFEVHCQNVHNVIKCIGNKNRFQNVFLYKGNEVIGFWDFVKCNENSKIIPTAWNTGRECGFTGKIIEIGFQLNIRYPLFEICYDFNAANTMYSKHTVYGQAIDKSKRMPIQRKNYFREVEIEGVPNNLDLAYRSMSGVEIHYPVDKGNEDYHLETDTLDRGHLTPYGDQIFMNFAIATNFLINVIPQASKNNRNENWHRIEDFVRFFCDQIGVDALIYQGGYRVAENITDLGPKLVYLMSNNRLPVPDFLWKFVRFDSSTEIVFITNNFNDNSPYEYCGSCKERVPYLILSGTVGCCTVAEIRTEFPDFPLPNIELPTGGNWLRNRAPGA